MKVLFVGDPVLDIICHASEQLLQELDFAPGGCDHINEDGLNRILSRQSLQEIQLRIPGGSAANVAKCFAGLMHISKRDGTVCFTGMLGDDDNGKDYTKMMEVLGVSMEFVAVHPTQPTGICLCLVTPDGQRTMRTCLRASNGFTGLPEGCLQMHPQVAHFEGYAAYRGEHTLQAMRDLKRRGTIISLDLASFEVVKTCIDVFKSILEEQLVDILFCNQDEASAFASMLELDDDMSQEDESQQVEHIQNLIKNLCSRYEMTTVVSRGKKGCMAGNGSVLASAPAASVKVEDTIGAGDYFSASFLYTWIETKGNVEKACVAGCMGGAAAVQTAGAQVPDDKMKILQEAVLHIIRQ